MGSKLRGIGPLLRAVCSREAAVQTDGQLLEQFLARHDEEAFAAIVRRHGPMVLGVCRRVLGNLADSEDAFQATFIVLLKKARSLTGRSVVGDWLHGVAWRTALKAKVAAAHRREKEHLAVHRHQTDAPRNDWLPILDEELSRLPQKYRLPIVLCDLEEKTRPEAAAQLGWAEGTVAGRLARGRALLAKQLFRRARTLSGAVSAAALSATEAHTALPPVLAGSTARAVTLLATGSPSAPHGLSSGVLALANGVIHSMLITRLKIGAVLFLAAAVCGVGIGTFGFGQAPVSPDGSQVGQASDTQKSENKRAEKKKTPSGVKQPAARDEADNAPVHISASGRVVDENSRPIKGAKVFLREHASMRDRASEQTPGYTDILARATTDTAGLFAFKNIAAEPMKVSPSNFSRHPWNLVVTAEGRGLAWHIFKSRREEGLTIVMGPEARLRGRLLDGKGKPASGVRVQITFVDDQLDPDQRRRVYSENRLELFWSRLPLAAVTDSAGNFMMTGLPRGLSVTLRASDPRFARTPLHCATIDRAEIDRLNAPPSVVPENKLLANGFTVTLEPNRSIRGRVIYRDTGKPVAGARVSMGILATRTDNDGRYSLDGFMARKWPLFVRPPEHADYLSASADVMIAADALVRQQDFALEPGSVITGRLREKGTGNVIRVPYVSIRYHAERPKDEFATARTKPDGTFRIVVPPGKGKLWTPDTLPGGGPRDWTTSLEKESQAIEIKPGQTLVGKDLFFTMGMVVQGRVFDMEGKPVSGAVFQGAMEQPPSGPDGAFTLRGLSREYPSHFLVVAGQRRQGAKLILEPLNDPAPIRFDVKLQPLKSVRARLVDAEKRPVTKAHVSVLANIMLEQNAHTFSLRPIPVSGPIYPDPTGRFTVTNLVVGGSYTVKASAPGYATVQAHVRVEDDKEPQLADLVFLPSTFVVAGVVVDPAGNPLEGVQVAIQPRNHALARNHDVLQTRKDGRFHFHGLPEAEYRLMAHLWKPTGEIDKDGRPKHTLEASTELRIESGRENVRVMLQPPQDPKRAARLVGKRAPDFAVSKWLNRPEAKDTFTVANHAGRVVLLAFLDEAKPSRRLLKTLNGLDEKHGAKGLHVVRVYETPVPEAELARLSPTYAALVNPGLLVGYSQAAQKYGVIATPTLFIIDRAGMVRYADADVGKLEKRIEELLKR